MCSSQSRVKLKGDLRLHAEEVFGCLRVRCTDGQPLVRNLVVRPGGGAPYGRTGGSEACRTGWQGGVLAVDQLHLFWVGHSHRLRDGHREVTA